MKGRKVKSVADKRLKVIGGVRGSVVRLACVVSVMSDVVRKLC